MVLKRSKCNLNSGNTISRHRYNLLKRIGTERHGFVAAAARVSSEQVEVAKRDMLKLADQLDLSEAFGVQNCHSETQRNGVISLEGVMYSINKRKRWETLDKFVMGMRQNIVTNLESAVSLIAVEKTPCNKQEMKHRLNRKTTDCIACVNYQAQPLEPEEKPKISHLWDGRACPKCETLIEKSMGCNHMVCTICDYEFCWACMKSLIFCRRNGCKPAKLKPIVLKDYQWKKVPATVCDDVQFHCSARGYPGYFSRLDISCFSSSPDSEDVEQPPNQQTENKGIKVTKRRVYHNQHFRGIQRPAKIKRGVELRRSRKQRVQKDEENTSPDPQAMITEDSDAELTNCERQQTESAAAPHLVYRIDLPKALSQYRASQVNLLFTKIGNNQFKRAPKIPVADAMVDYLDSRSTFDDGYDWCDEEQDSEESSAQSARENQRFDLVDFVRTPNPKASRSSRRVSKSSEA